MNYLVVKNIGELVTVRSDNQPKKGKDMQDVEILHNAYLVVSKGKFLDIGVGEVPSKYTEEAISIIDAKGKLITPGLIDAHTHLVHGGSRENEFGMKLNGVPYLEILKQGGGILSSVRSTREATFDELYDKAKKSLNEMLKFGVTTVEAKSGYGLDLNTELKQLMVANELNKKHPVEIVSTFLGAHAIPEHLKQFPNAYVNDVIDMIPTVVKEELAEFCDVFCEDGVFSVEQSRKILSEAKKHGLKAKIHADEIVSLGGAELAAELECISADHLMAASDTGIKMLADKNVICNLLPGTSFYLNKDYADARKMIDNGCAISLSTDYNPGSSPSENMQFIMQLGSLKLRMTPKEVISAVTINAAYALNRQDTIGSIEIGKDADFVLFDANNLDYIIYHYGINHTLRVFKKGEMIYQK